jgi:hypothetical protein
MGLITKRGGEDHSAEEVMEQNINAPQDGATPSWFVRLTTRFSLLLPSP